MDWVQALTVFAIIGINIGIVIVLYIQTDTKLTAISEEMKDFHTLLALQDQEFKNRLCRIEESRITTKGV
jgi:uncharacterized membrane-anchored protein YhcB (DUF1043 family)